MNQTVTLLLFFSATPAERSALATFQTREKVALVAPAALAAPVAGVPTSTARPGRYSEDAALGIEAALDEAETLAASLDETRALELLAEVERTLLAHAELPQAAWLMAERHQLAAAIRRRQPDGASDAEALLASARALEGPRAAPFEVLGATPAQTTPVPAVAFAVGDLDVADVLSIDGRIATGSASVLPGRHHVQVRRDSRLAWLGWVDVAAGSERPHVLGVPPRVACSQDDLAEVSLGTRTPVVPRGVRCARWVGVRRGHEGLEVAWCERGRCTAYGPLLAEEEPKAAPAAIPPWLAGALVGVATAGAAAILIGSGAFAREQPATEVRLVYRGP